MTISFDLDDMLIPGMKRFPVEKAGLWHRLFSNEKLRKGTVALFGELKKRGYSVCIYTTSYRSKAAIRRLFFSYGIFPYKIINKQLHNKQAGSIGQKASKYPPAFGIDWHVDDAEGVHLEGELFGFRVLIVEEGDENWVEKVLQLQDAKL